MAAQLDVKMLEGLMIIAVVIVFGLWQFRSLRRDREELQRRKAEREQDRDRR
ncbi:hypothetical protein [Ectothiorhodospira mobilis]|uniref:Uncharacterized protein n=1 Tax=Ectothiorhodospira mobilis TaxID=195064 RepID=A0A1I4RZL8_ECTMO|nr:hypothetical protein [Ectothiorhodospira mobilis]MCG5536530.1 hypothetical protein [Ectothiorhodospira mobilis]SFM57667.1 hypothetical protein SAMN05421721_11130 [Ectothiorhodospira mobilis]